MWVLFFVFFSLAGQIVMCLNVKKFLSLLGHVAWQGHRTVVIIYSSLALTTDSTDFHALCHEILLINPVIDHDPHLTKEQASVIKD